MEAFETFEHAGFTVELHQDIEPSSPADWDNLGELVSFSKLWADYAFGMNGRTPGRESTSQEDDAYERGGWPLLERYLLSACGYVCAVPFSFSDYGSRGSRLTPGDAGGTHDYGIAGFICTTADRVEELGAPRGDVERQLRGELADWAAMVAGEVVGVVVRDPQTRKVIDSVWGMYPERAKPGVDVYDFAREEGRWMAESERDERIARAEARQLGWALARVTRPRLEYLRGELRAERISYGELAELQGLAPYIEPSDVELLEAAGVPEFPDDSEGSRSTAGAVNGAEGGRPR